VVALRESLAEGARRNNETTPKDGSELQQMSAYDSVAFPTVTGDVDDADVGYYGVARFTLTGSNHDLTGIANGAGQEGVGGRLLRIINTSASGLDLDLRHEHADSVVANRFILPSDPYPVAQNETAQLWYDIAALRWRLAA
jgi:hypothetical protein